MNELLLSSLPSQVNGLLREGDYDEPRIVEKILHIWAQKSTRNILRRKYYDGHNRIKDLGMSIPPSMRNVETVVGWPAKGVDVLAARSQFEGFVTTGDDQDPFGLSRVLEDNQFSLLYREATTSELIHSCAFITVANGRKEDGEPEVLVSLRSAEEAAAIWDYRHRRIKAGLAVTEREDTEPFLPLEFVLYTNSYVVTCAKTGTEWKVVDRQENFLGRPTIEPLVFRPTLDRPFGHSRITREVMSITDSAVRAALRAEVLMEFNTAPPKYLLGAEEDAFRQDKWSAYMSKILTISRDSDGDIPTIGQFPQLSPQGAILYMQHLASRFAGATGLPVSSLGVVSDNPSSAQAMETARVDLVDEANALNLSNGAALANIARMIVAFQKGVAISDLPTEAQQLRPRFKNPVRPSVVSQSDAIVKQVQAIPWLANSTVLLEELGYDESQIVRLLADKKRADGGSLLSRALAAATNTAATASPAQGEADVNQETTADLKAKFDALGIAIRAGVDPGDAANRVGLSGVKFTGAIPVSLRVPESDAVTLEDK